MARLRVAPIVEGDGDVESIRILMGRLWVELSGEFIDILRPIRIPKSKLVKEAEFKKAILTAILKLAEHRGPDDPSLVLVLIDADEDCPAELGPRLHQWAKDEDPRVDFACVIAKVEYETWFAAAAQSLVDAGYLKLDAGEVIPDDPEGRGCRKKWIEDRFVAHPRYSETRDQPGMTGRMDLKACRDRSPSFDKLCRELESRIRRDDREAGG